MGHVTISAAHMDDVRRTAEKVKATIKVLATK
jgi:hypothetical protein